MKDRLKAILELMPTTSSMIDGQGKIRSFTSFSDIADYLIANGVIVPPCKPIGVMTDGNEFNTDVYCPYCGTNLSGFYGDEPAPIIQCYNCGEFLDNRKSITREEAEKALAERSAE